MALGKTYNHTSGAKHGAQVLCDRDAFMITGLITFDSDYASGGETFDLSAYFTKVLFVGFDAASGGAVTGPAAGAGYGTYICQYDYNATVASAKILIFGAESTDFEEFNELKRATDLSAYSVRFWAIGY